MTQRSLYQTLRTSPFVLFMAGALIAGLTIHLVNDYKERQSSMDAGAVKFIAMLESAGFTDIELVPNMVVQCVEDNVLAAAFTAKDSSGEAVEGTVCFGLDSDDVKPESLSLTYET